MKIGWDPSTEPRVVDSGYTDQVRLDYVDKERIMRIRAIVYNSLSDLNKLFHVDRVLYTNSPDAPLFYEFTPQNMVSMRTPVIISEVKLYSLEELWGMSTLRMMK
jgi:hypothetical protein